MRASRKNLSTAECRQTYPALAPFVLAWSSAFADLDPRQ